MKLKDFLFPPIFAIGLAIFPGQAPGETLNTCSRYQSVTVGPYIVQTDYWNQVQCPGTQCVRIDAQTASFTVTKSTAICPNVSSYPSIVYGKAWGLVSPQKDLPAQISSLKCVNSSWSFQPTYDGSWDAAYDLWVCPDNQCGPSGFNGGAELMVWIDYLDCFPTPDKTSTVRLEGKEWDLFQTNNASAGQHWNYIAYSAKTHFDSVSNLDLNDFLKDSAARGYIKPSWYLYAVEAGNEMRDRGVPFTSKTFSVSINKECGAPPLFHPEPIPTPVPTATPDTTPIPPPPE